MSSARVSCGISCCVFWARAGAPERPNPASATNNTHQITWYWVCVVPTGVLPRILSVIYSIIVPLDMSVSSVLCGMIVDTTQSVD